MFNPQFADDDVMYTAVNILPRIRLIVSVNTQWQQPLYDAHSNADVQTAPEPQPGNNSGSRKK